MVIAADLNGYKIDEIVSVTLPSAQTVSKVFDGGLKQTAPTLPYPARYINGISVKAVDLNSDGIFGWDLRMGSRKSQPHPKQGYLPR
jgi:hypothetical protein